MPFPPREIRAGFPVAGRVQNCENSGPQITEARMPIEIENGNARRASRSAARRARGTARHGFACGFGMEKNGPERRAVPSGSGTRWQGKRGEVRARGERLAETGCAKRPRSFGGLRHPEEFGQQYVTGDSGYTLDFDRALRSYVSTLPAKHGRLVNGGREQLSECLKGHSVMLFAVLGYLRSVRHADLSCISCNFWQGDMMHFSITKSKSALDKVAS